MSSCAGNGHAWDLLFLVVEVSDVKVEADEKEEACERQNCRKQVLPIGASELTV